MAYTTKNRIVIRISSIESETESIGRIFIERITDIKADNKQIKRNIIPERKPFI